MSSPSEKEKKQQQIYIGKLSRKVKQEDLEKEFEKFGKLSDVAMKNGFAFIVTDISQCVDLRGGS